VGYKPITRKKKEEKRRKKKKLVSLLKAGKEVRLAGPKIPAWQCENGLGFDRLLSYLSGVQTVRDIVISLTEAVNLCLPRYGEWVPRYVSR
jgi:hypothetical protein